MAEIRHLENRHYVIFFCWGWSDLDKISQTGAEWHVDCGDMINIETRCRIPIWRTFGRIAWHVIPEPPATLIIVNLYSACMWSHLKRAQHWGCCHLANSMSWFQSYVSHCRVLPPGEFNGMSSQSHYHITGCCNFVNSPSFFQSHMLYCRVQSPGEINVMIAPHCRV